jgi:hypothetical protein
MVYLTWLIYIWFVTLVKGLKFKFSKFTFHLLLFFNQESPFDLFLHARAHVC